jgi:hypothetical protein
MLIRIGKWSWLVFLLRPQAVTAGRPDHERERRLQSSGRELFSDDLRACA